MKTIWHDTLFGLLDITLKIQLIIIKFPSTYWKTSNFRESSTLQLKASCWLCDREAILREWFSQLYLVKFNTFWAPFHDLNYYIEREEKEDDPWRLKWVVKSFWFYNMSKLGWLDLKDSHHGTQVLKTTTLLKSRLNYNGLVWVGLLKAYVSLFTQKAKHSFVYKYFSALLLFSVWVFSLSFATVFSIIF
jgi:hypothetical protein